MAERIQHSRSASDRTSHDSHWRGYKQRPLMERGSGATIGGRWLSADELLGRVGFLAIAAYAFQTGLKIYSAAGIWPLAVPLSLLMYSVAVLNLGSIFWVRQPLGRRVQTFLGVALLVTLGSAIAYEIAFANPGYGTDAIAFAHVGAEVVLDGQNPYEIANEPLAPVIERFGVPATFVTRSISGEPIDRLISYPAGHVLTYTGGAALGLEDMRWVTLAFEVVSVAVMWWALLPSARSILVLVLLIEPNLMVLFTSGGVTDWIWVLPLLLTALALTKHRFGWAGLAAGVACAMKQQPWFVVPFVVVWVYKVSKHLGGIRARDSVTSFIAGLVAAFGILNLPFILWSPVAWVQGVLAPALSDLVPDGQGFSVLASRGILPVPNAMFVFLTLGLLLVCLLYYARRFERVQDLLWVVPAAVLLFSYRSFHNYFVYWLPLILFWLCLRADVAQPVIQPRQDAIQRPFGWRPSRSMMVLLAALALSGVIAALMAGGGPLRVGGVSPNLSQGVLTSLDIEVTNTSDEPAVPVIDIYWGGWPVPWEPEARSTIPPGETRLVRAFPTSPDVMPALDGTGSDSPSYKPFRVRLNAKGHSGFVASPIVEVPALEAAIINPDFALWGRTSHSSGTAPFGWTSIRREGVASSLVLGPASRGSGVTLRVGNVPGQEEGWSEAGLTQSLSELSSCYEARLRYSPSIAFDERSPSRGEVGVQFIQESRSLWFVASAERAVRVTDLPGGTRIVEVPIAADDWHDVTFDLNKYLDGSDVEVGQPATVKIFNALAQNEVGPQELNLSHIGECDPRTS